MIIFQRFVFEGEHFFPGEAKVIWASLFDLYTYTFIDFIKRFSKQMNSNLTELIVFQPTGK